MCVTKYLKELCVEELCVTNGCGGQEADGRRTGARNTKQNTHTKWGKLKNATVGVQSEVVE